MALVALTNAQKEVLKYYPPFRAQVDWAIYNKAEYWAGLDGTNLGAIPPVKWAKSRLWATNNILPNPTSIQTDANYTLFLILLTHSVYDPNVPFNPDTVITYMLSGNASYNIFDAVADLLFDEKIKSIIL